MRQSTLRPLRADRQRQLANALKTRLRRRFQAELSAAFSIFSPASTIKLSTECVHSEWNMSEVILDAKPEGFTRCRSDNATNDSRRVPGYGPRHRFGASRPGRGLSCRVRAVRRRRYSVMTMPQVTH